MSIEYSMLTSHVMRYLLLSEKDERMIVPELSSLSSLFYLHSRKEIDGEVVICTLVKMRFDHP